VVGNANALRTLPPSAKGESKIKTHHKHVRKKYTSPGASARAFAVSIGFVHQQEGSQRFTLASFREPLAAWKIAVRVFGIACLLYGLVEEIRYGKSNSWTLLFWVGMSATLFYTLSLRPVL
jgi:hypothetical protein